MREYETKFLEFKVFIDFCIRITLRIQNNNNNNNKIANKYMTKL